MRLTRIITALIIPTAIGVGFAPAPAEASFSISYSSGGDWAYYGHKHRRRYADKRPRYSGYYRNKGYGFPRYARPYAYRNYPYYSTSYRRVYDLPRTAKFVWIDGYKYYTYGGNYYRRSDCGTYYIVVDNPHTYREPPQDEITHYYEDTVYESNQKEFVVHVRGKDGKLVTVRLTKEDDGYVGPQGEIYPEFPKVAQLREMYAD